jgi:hypothetical protein
MTSPTPRRALLTAALGFLQLRQGPAEVAILHRWPRWPRTTRVILRRALPGSVSKPVGLQTDPWPFVAIGLQTPVADVAADASCNAA